MQKHSVARVAAAALVSMCLSGQTRVDLQHQGRSVNFAGADRTIPVRTGAELPPTCQTGEQFFDTAAPPGENLHLCTDTNVWSTVREFHGHNSGELRDFQVLTAGKTATIAPGRFSAGNVFYDKPGATANITAGSGSGGSAKVYIDSNGVLMLAHPAAAGLTVSCTNCVQAQVAAPAVPGGAIPIAEIAIVNGAWGMVTDQRAFLNLKHVAVSDGLQLDSTRTTFSVDPTVARRDGGNVWLGDNDFSASNRFIARRGAGAPAAGECDAAAEVGNLYARADATGRNATLYVCANTAAGTFAWELAQPGAPQLGSTSPKPACGAGNRGTLWYTAGAAGVKDTVEVCAKDAAEAYAWRVLY